MSNLRRFDSLILCLLKIFNGYRFLLFFRNCRMLIFSLDWLARYNSYSFLSFIHRTNLFVALWLLLSAYSILFYRLDTSVTFASMFVRIVSAVRIRFDIGYGIIHRRILIWKSSNWSRVLFFRVTIGKGCSWRVDSHWISSNLLFFDDVRLRLLVWILLFILNLELLPWCWIIID